MQDTRSSWASVVPGGRAIVCSAQLVPFQRSANPKPTAVHADALVQETPSSSLNVAPDGLGVPWMLQLEPFHTSARVSVSVPSKKLPTATHAVADVHATPFSWLRVVPLGTGTVRVDQLVPFQRSASACGLPLASASPTAMHAARVEQEMPASSVLVAPAGFGVLCTVQLLPFHASASDTVVVLVE